MTKKSTLESMLEDERSRTSHLLNLSKAYETAAREFFTEKRYWEFMHEVVRVQRLIDDCKDEPLVALAKLTRKSLKAKSLKSTEGA